MSIAPAPLGGSSQAIERINAVLWPVTGEIIAELPSDHRDDLTRLIEEMRQCRQGRPHRPSRQDHLVGLEAMEARLRCLDATTAALATPAKAETIAARLEAIAASDAPRSTQAKRMVAVLEGRSRVRTGHLYDESLLQKLNNLPEFLRKLAKSGWYLSDRLYDEMPWNFPDIVKDGNREKIDRIIIKCLQEQIDSIKYEIIGNYPERRDALSEAFDVHKQGKYYCSIPVFYSQADGIFKDKFGGGIFMYHRRIKVAENEIELFDNSITYVESLLSNDADTLPGSSRSKNLYDLDSCIRRGFLLSNNFHGLERNSIMHGDSVDYGNELKSLKAISFLDWVHYLERER